MDHLYYLCFTVNKLPDLTLTKYSVFDGSSVENIMDKHGVFLRQLHRLGSTSKVYFHLLYYYNPDKSIPKGRHLTIIFYATSQSKDKLDGIREFLTTSVLSTYYDFFCYEISRNFAIEEEILADGSKLPLLRLTNLSGVVKKYSLGRIKLDTVLSSAREIANGTRSHIVCELASDADVILSFNRMPVDSAGRIISDKKFCYGAFLTKKDYFLPAQNRLSTDGAGDVSLYSIMEWEPSENGRLYNVLKLMEGYDRSAVLRIDIFPVEHTQALRQRLPYAETRRRISERAQGKDDNSESIVKSWDKYLSNLMKFPQFLANVVAFADSEDIAVMLADSVAAEAVESGTYLVETIASERGFSMYESDVGLLQKEKEPGNYVAPFLSLYTLEEIRPMFSFPILYPGEAIECQKETDPIPFSKEVTVDSETGEKHEVISLGVSSMGYDVTFPVKLFKKHAFIAGVPGAGKTNTMLYLVTTLWRDTEQHVPFLVLEPAKQEYRALAMIEGMEDLCVFSPGADTYFPLHINPFEFPEGLTLAEHIANLNAVFAGAFELIPPSPFLIDSCIEKVYLQKGWNINERNNGSREYPTMQELYDSLKVAVEESGYEGETKANIRSVMEVRIGSLLRREIGNVYNVRESSIRPEEWLSRPVIIELEALGEGPANFLSLLISTLIREVLKIRKTSDVAPQSDNPFKREIEHVIFYEEAHNLIGPTTDDPVGGSVDPKISATKYLVKMLAEVRALGEGIVIADQLPTAMAPEVLKNTGLKLAHRITAQDDRNLLGSTMSASADQLEEQGTFGTGQALIFYENLLKPFKMRVCEWEKGVSQKKYDSPTNRQLFEHLKNNRVYHILLGRSAKIMREKMNAEFELLRDQARNLKNSIEKKNAELKHRSDDLENLNRKLERLQAPEEIAQTKKHIAELRLAYEKNQHEFSGALSRDMKKLCWNYVNQYHAYMTLSKNYHVYSDDMYMCTILNYLTLFGIMRSLHNVPLMNDILLEETKDVAADISKYIDLEGLTVDACLADHPGYSMALFAAGDFINSRIDAEAQLYQRRAEDVLRSADALEGELVKYCRQFTADVLRNYQLAEAFYANAVALADAQQYAVDDILEPDSREWEEAGSLAVEYRSRAAMIYKALAAYVCGVFKKLDGLEGANRSVLLRHTQEVLTKYRTIVNYRNRNEPTVLSDWDGYETLWLGANSIAFLEMSAQFDYFHQIRIQKLGQMNEMNIDMVLFTELCKNYNTLFKKYYLMDIDTNNFRYALVQHYRRFLDDVINIGKCVYPVLFKYSRDNWVICRRLMNAMIDSGQVSVSTASDWNKLSVKVTRGLKMIA